MNTKEVMMRTYLEETNLQYIKVMPTDEMDYNMYYNIEEQVIRYNESTLKTDLSNYNNVTYEDFFEIIFCHEVGHILDVNLPKNHELANILLNKIKDNPFSNTTKNYLKDLEKIKYENEKNAWKNASAIIRESLLNEFEHVKEIDLANAKEIAKLEVEILKNNIELARRSAQ